MNDTARRAGRLFILFAISLALPLLAPRAAYAERHWYETYELAVQLVDGGQVDKASTLLNELIDEYPVPLASVRVPGDRFINYHPYYQRARIQLQKGDYEGASFSLGVCELFGAIHKNRRMEKQFLDLRRQIANKTASLTAINSPAVAPARD